VDLTHSRRIPGRPRLLEVQRAHACLCRRLEKLWFFVAVERIHYDGVELRAVTSVESEAADKVRTLFDEARSVLRCKAADRWDKILKISYESPAGLFAVVEFLNISTGRYVSSAFSLCWESASKYR